MRAPSELLGGSWVADETSDPGQAAKAPTEPMADEAPQAGDGGASRTGGGRDTRAQAGGEGECRRCRDLHKLSAAR